MNEQIKMIPCIFLDKNADIIDLSSDLVAMLNSASKAALLRSFNSADKERFIDFCASPASPKSESLSYIRNSSVFEIHLRQFRYAFAKKTGHFNGPITELYLFKNDTPLFDPELPFSSRLHGLLIAINEANPTVRKALAGLGNLDNSSRITDIFDSSFLTGISENNVAFSEYFSKLFIPPTDNTVNEMDFLTRTLITRLKDNPDIVYSEIEYNGYEGTISPESVKNQKPIAIDIRTYIVLFTSLISVLNAASDDYKIRVSLNVISDSIEVCMSTHAESIPAVLNNTSDIISIAPYISGTYMVLSLAYFVASKKNMRLNTYCSKKDGLFGFSFGRISNSVRELDFRYRDPLEGFDEMFDTAAKLILEGFSSSNE